MIVTCQAMQHKGNFTVRCRRRVRRRLKFMSVRIDYHNNTRIFCSSCCRRIVIKPSMVGN